MNSNIKLHLLTWIIAAPLCAISWSLVAFGVIPIWSAVIATIIAPIVSPTIAWLVAAAFLRGRYLQFITTAKNEQDEMLARMDERRREKRRKRNG